MKNEKLYFVDKKTGAVCCNSGLPWQPRLFCDNRLMAEIKDNAISEIRYFNKNGNGSNMVFRRNFLKATGFFLETESRNYELELSDTQMYPFGFFGSWNLNEYRFGFSFCVVNDSIVIILKTPESLPDEYKYHFEIRKNAFFVPPQVEKVFSNPQLSGGDRRWSEFLENNGIYKASFKESDADAYIAMMSNFDAKLRVTTRNTKYDFFAESIKPNTEYVWVISLGCDEEKTEKVCRNTVQNYKEIVNEKTEIYRAVFDKTPRFDTGYEYVDNFMNLAPLYNESLKVNDVPGIIRANTKHYFAWGSDSVTEANSIYFWGDNEYNKEIMDVAVSAGFPVICAYGNDGKNLHKKDKFTVGGNIFFINYLYCYISGGGTLTASLYDFSKKIFEETLKVYDKKSGMFITGSSAEFDYSSLFKSMHSTDEVLGFKENIQIYTAFRSMQALAYIVGDIKTVEQITPIVEKFEKNADKVFFDETAGYYSFAVDGATGEKSSMFSPYLARVENEFLSDVVHHRYTALTKFFKENYVSENGIRPLNKNDKDYDGDANQMHCWWPAYNSDFYIRCINEANDKELLDKFIGWVSFWSERLTIPEGIDCYCDNKNLEFDDWNMCCGAWQLYNYRAFYQAIVRGMYGLDFDMFGVTVFPHSCKDISVKNLHAMGRSFDFDIIGCGDFVESVTVNGVELRGTNRIPFDILKDCNTVLVKKCENAPKDLQIMRFNSAKITDYSFSNKEISCSVEVAGHAVLAIAGDIDKILVDGRPVTGENLNNETVIHINWMGKKRLVVVSK